MWVKAIVSKNKLYSIYSYLKIKISEDIMAFINPLIG